MIGPEADHSIVRGMGSWLYDAEGVLLDHLLAKQRRHGDLSRQNAEFVDVPITDKHLDPGQHFLTAAQSARD